MDGLTTISRRTLIAAAGAAGVAGCLSDDDPTAERDHPATGEDSLHPTLGSTDADATVVAFEDPSCSTCATFATETLPELRDRDIDPGHVRYQWRGVPWTAPWSETAIRVLYALFDSGPEAFWTVKDAFYDRQDDIDTDSVVEESADLLANAGVDPDPILDSVEDGGFADRVADNESAANASEVSAVPSFVLFDDGAHVTTVVGAQPYDVFAGALDR